MSNIPEVQVYPSTQIVTGEVTLEDHMKRSALALYDEWVCDRRWSPEDVCKLIMWAKENRDAT